MKGNTLENSWIHLKGILSESLAKEIVVVGNGASKFLGMKELFKGDTLGVFINNVPEGVDNSRVLFTVATKLAFAKDLSLRLGSSHSIFVPNSLNLGNEYIQLPDSNIDYLEGISDPDPSLSTFVFRNDFVLLTILDVLNFLSSQTREGNLSVQLVGFDFEIDPESNALMSPMNSLYLTSLLERQKSIFKTLQGNKSYYPHLVLNTGIAKESVTHSILPNRQIPDFTEKDLSDAIAKNNALLANVISDASEGKVQIVAELTNNHLGDTTRLIEMVKMAQVQGASLIKIQLRDPYVLYTQDELAKPYSSPFGKTLEDYRLGVELTVDQVRFLTIVCAQIEIPWFTSVLDQPSLEKVSEFSPVMVKAPSTISDHKNFLTSISESTIEWIFISTGGTNIDFVEWVAKTFATKKLVVMQCTSSYPTSPEDCNVNTLHEYKRVLSGQSALLGYSSHDAGSFASQLAIAAGAVFLEKHVKMGSIDWIHFDGVALDLLDESFSAYVKDLRDASLVLGSHQKTVLPSEHHKYKPNSRNN
jgi:N-acetylneuraminate synthase